MKINYDMLTKIPLVIRNISVCKMTEKDPLDYDYESSGRQKNLLFLQLENERLYYRGDTLLFRIAKGDVLFLPHGVHYRSVVKEKESPFGGIGVSFDLLTEDGEEVCPDCGIRALAYRAHAKYHKKFERLFFLRANPHDNALRMRGTLYSLFDELLAEGRSSFRTKSEDISPAIRQLEDHPEENLQTAELAAMCMMSESTFLRRFKRFTGGVTPVKYRNDLRFMLAEELVGASLTLNEIAERVGFYDAAHLSKAYRLAKGQHLGRR